MSTPQGLNPGMVRTERVQEELIIPAILVHNRGIAMSLTDQSEVILQLRLSEEMAKESPELRLKEEVNLHPPNHMLRPIEAEHLLQALLKGIIQGVAVIQGLVVPALHRHREVVLEAAPAVVQEVVQVVPAAVLPEEHVHVQDSLQSFAK